jgi:hypothetical protein
VLAVGRTPLYVVVIMARKTCPCGHTRGHPLVEEEPEYTLWGWLLLSLVGISPYPDHINYRCTICRKSLGVTRDPAVLARKGKPAPTAAAQPPAQPEDGSPPNT